MKYIKLSQVQYIRFIVEKYSKSNFYKFDWCEYAVMNSGNNL